MKRTLIVGLSALVGTAAAVAVTPVRELPDAVAGWNATADRAAELDTLARLGQAQRDATDDLVARLTDGGLTLNEAVALMDSNTQGRPVFREQLAAVRPEGTDLERLSGYVVERAKERVGSDAGQVSALMARLQADGK